MRDRIEGETVIYAMDVIMENLRFGRPEGFVEVEPPAQAIAVMTEFEGRPRALHPAVWTRAPGEKVLHVSPWMAKGIVGREDADGEALLAAVCDEIVASAKDLCYFHHWQPTDMVIWDNWRCLHSVSGMAPDVRVGACTAPPSRATTASAASRASRPCPDAELDPAGYCQAQMLSPS